MQHKQLVGMVGLQYKIGHHGIDHEYRNIQWYSYSSNDDYSVQDKWLKGIVETCRRDRFITTTGGRRRYLTDIVSSDPRQRAAAERQAVNSAAQV